MSFYKNIAEIKKYSPGEYLNIGERRVVDADEIIEKSGQKYAVYPDFTNIVIEAMSVIPISPRSCCEGCAFLLNKSGIEGCWISQFATPNCYDRKLHFHNAEDDSIIFKKINI